jgi:hypothetical protein
MRLIPSPERAMATVPACSVVKALGRRAAPRARPPGRDPVRLGPRWALDLGGISEESRKFLGILDLDPLGRVWISVGQSSNRPCSGLIAIRRSDMATAIALRQPRLFPPAIPPGKLPGPSVERTQAMGADHVGSQFLVLSYLRHVAPPNVLRSGPPKPPGRSTRPSNVPAASTPPSPSGRSTTTC